MALIGPKNPAWREKRPPPTRWSATSDEGRETIADPEPLPDPREAELYTHASDVISRYEQDYFRERWFGSDQGLIYFAWEAVKTLDEGDTETPIKALPREAYLLDHFQNLLREDLYVVLKSRQIMITWATFIFLVWQTMRLPYQKIGVVPKKSDDGKDHIEDRIQAIIWNYLPLWLRDDFPEPDLVRGKFQLNWHRGAARWAPQFTVGEKWFSWLASFEKGEHQIRQYTLTDIFWDEMAFQDHARKAWQAALPSTIRRGKNPKGTGKVQCVSTMLPDSFHDTLCGDNATVDAAVAIAFGDIPPPESGFYKSPIPGVCHYRNHKYGAFVAVYSFLADSEKRDPMWEAQASIKLGGKNSPEWNLDYRMQRGAFRGRLIFPHYDRRWNVIAAREVNRECEIFISMDFGHTVPTAVGFWEWNEQEQTLVGFDEIYLTGASIETIKKLVALKLATHLRMAVEDVLFADVLGHNVADPEDPGRMMEFAAEPNPLYLTGNPAPDSGQKGWKINDKETGFARMDSALRPSFVHCGTRQYAFDGKTSGTCQSVVVDAIGNKKLCEVEVVARPMLMFMEGRMPALEMELPQQQRTDRNDPSLEPQQGLKKGVANHACFVAGTMIATPNGEHPIQRMVPGDLVWTTKGLRRVIKAGCSNPAAQIIERGPLTGTPDHPVWTEGGWVRLDSIRYDDIITTCQRSSFSTESPSVATPSRSDAPIGSTTSPQIAIETMAWGDFTRKSGRPSTGQSREGATSTTRTATPSTTPSGTLNASLPQNISVITASNANSANASAATSTASGRWPQLGTVPQRASSGIAATQPQTASAQANSGKSSAANAGMSTSAISGLLNTAPGPASKPIGAQLASMMLNANAQLAASASRPSNIAELGPAPASVAPVFALTVEGAAEFFANGVLVSNCDETRYAVMRYPHFFGLESLAAPVPRFMRLSPEKLTTKERFWRERHELIENSMTNAAAFEEAGEIVYPDSDEEDDDAYA